MKKKTIILLACSFLLAGCGEENSSQTTTPSDTPSKNEDISVSGITLKETSKELEIGETYQITPTLTPSNATNTLVSYSSSNENVASVSLLGLVTAKSAGKATIVVTSDANPEVKATLTLEVKAKDITSFDIAFPNDIEEFNLNGTTYKQLIIGSSYTLNPTFVGKDTTTLEASFSTPGFASFDSKTNTLKAEKEITRLDVTFSAKGTALPVKKYVFRLLSKGKADQAIAFAKLKKSAELEENKSVNAYTFEFKSEGNQTGIKTVEGETIDYTVYQEGQHSYMVGLKEKSKKVGSDPQVNTNLTTFKGIGQDNNYYELEINDSTYKHEKDPLKKIVTTEEAGSGEITRADAIKKGTLLEHNTRFGLSNIASAMVDPSNSGYDYFTGKSYPYYFGGSIANTATYETTVDGFLVKGYTIEEKPTSYSDGMVFFNEGTFVFDENNLLKSVTVVDKVYDKTGFDFTNNTLLENATPINTYTIKYTQEFGEIGNEEELEGRYAIDVNDLYFKSFQIDLTLGNTVIDPKKLVVNQTYAFQETNQTPNIATSKIDPILLTNVSDKTAISISDGGLKFKVLKEGSATLTFYSAKNNKQFALNVSTTLPDATSIVAKQDNKTLTSGSIVTGVTNKAITGFYFETYPTTSAQTGTDPTFTFTDSEGVEAGSICSFTKSSETINNHPTYSFKATKAGTYTVTASYGNISTSFKVSITDPVSGGSLSDEVIKHDFSVTALEWQVVLHFDSKTSGKMNGYVPGGVTSFIEGDNDAGGQFTFECSIDDTNKTIIFTSITFVGGSRESLTDYFDNYFGYIPQQNAAFTIADSGESFTGNFVWSEDEEEPEQATFVALK